MHQKRSYKICICSIMLGDRESSKLQSSNPTFLSSIDPYQYGFIPCSSTTFALIARLHRQFRRCGLWELLWGLRKAFDLVDHWTLVAKLHSLIVKPVTLKWNGLRWSFLAMINALKVPGGSKLMWKFPDDNTTIPSLSWFHHPETVIFYKLSTALAIGPGKIVSNRIRPFAKKCWPENFC